jgi:hypothetical protein
MKQTDYEQRLVAATRRRLSEALKEKNVLPLGM